MHWCRVSVERLSFVLQHDMVSVMDIKVLGAMLELLPESGVGHTVEEIARLLECSWGAVEAAMQLLSHAHLVQRLSPGRYQLNSAYIKWRNPDLRQAQRQRREAARAALRHAAKEMVDAPCA